ncbi:hypothetical protein AC579_2940 [Pseudocercospora musae]|uniref:Uncharacterized protein n=1 Tax=Pseudocercospora musae TaxID=113226 RepID=A0A139GZ34_9PEZI|nr:hypothetical protein AC579_2940 [Pseudocercospora musae]
MPQYPSIHIVTFQHPSPFTAELSPHSIPACISSRYNTIHGRNQSAQHHAAVSEHTHLVTSQHPSPFTAELSPYSTTHEQHASS